MVRVPSPASRGASTAIVRMTHPQSGRRARQRTRAPFLVGLALGAQPVHPEPYRRGGVLEEVEEEDDRGSERGEVTTGVWAARRTAPELGAWV